jgi:riboflavin kinase / FMN adenylyltransferase
MRTHFGLPAFPPAREECVLTLGVFDGVHRGHQAVVGRTVARARDVGAEALVLTFDTHPRAVVRQRKPAFITSLKHRLELFARLAADITVVLPFDEELARLPAEAFAREVLRDRLAAKQIVLGEGSHFGRGRQGSPALLERLGPELDLEVETVAPVLLDDAPISSTRVREAVEAADLARAREMLGRPVSVLGTVVHGNAIGRTLGFPTLNLDPHHELHPPRGVYVSRACVGETCWPAVTNIGHRPTFDAQTGRDVLIETHVLDRAIGELNGQMLEVTFLERLREEKRFAGREALVEAIRADCEAARAWFALETA